jgi:hypothetical protein
MKRVVLFLVAFACTAAFAHADNCAPSRASDLGIQAIGKTTVLLSFTDSGEDCLTGTAGSYEVRRSGAAITEANYYSATVVTSAGTPSGSGGTTDCYKVGGLSMGTTYYFAITFTDGSGNRSPVSNSISATTHTTGFDVDCP